MHHSDAPLCTSSVASSMITPPIPRWNKADENQNPHQQPPHQGQHRQDQSAHTPTEGRGMEQASEKGVLSSWVTTIPLSKYGFNMHKQAFRDTLSLRYEWTPARLASHCPCRYPFNVSHALSCPKGPMPIIQHNGIRDIFAQLLTEVFLNVGVEPALQPLSGERFHQRSTNMEDSARLDIRAQDFWDKSKRSTFLMSGSSTPLRPPTARPPPKLATEGTSSRRDIHMRIESSRLRKGPLPHWSCLQMEVVDHMPRLPSRG